MSDGRRVTEEVTRRPSPFPRPVSAEAALTIGAYTVRSGRQEPERGGALRDEEVRSEGPPGAHPRRRVPRPRDRQAVDESGAGGVHRRAGGEGGAGRRRSPRSFALHQPRAEHARLLRARAGRGSRHQQPPPGAGQVRRHRRLDPRRVLHGAHRRPAAAGRGRRHRGVRRRLHAAAVAAARAGARLGHHEGGAPVLQRAQARARGGRHPHRRPRRPRRGAARHAAGATTRTRSSRCSRRWRSTRAARSRTSPT